MNGIRKNRLTISNDREYDGSYDSGRLPVRMNSRKKIQITAASIILLAALGGTVFLITKYKKNEDSILSRLELGSGEKENAYTRGDKFDTPGTESENVHLRRGIDSYSKGYFNDAANEFDQVINSDSSSKDKAQALTYLGIIEDERGNYSKSIDYYKRALKYDSDSKLSASTYRNMAITYRKMKLLSEALDSVNKAIALAPESANNLILRGNIYYEQRKFSEALDSYKDALKQEPSNASALYNTAQVYLKKSDEPLAIEYFKKAVESDRSGKIAYLAHSKLGIIFLERGDYPIAEQYLKNAVNMNPNDAADHYNLGIVYLRSGKNESALPEFLRAQELGAQDNEMLENLGAVYTTLKEYDKGIDVYNRILQNNARNTKILARLGELLYNKGELEDAMKAFRKITELEPASENARIAYVNIGNIYDESLRFDEAIEAYNKALSLNAKDDSAYFNLGIAYKHKGENEKAMEAWQNSKRLNPDNPKPHMALADLLYDLGYLDDAQSEYIKITEKWPMLADAQFAIATIYNKKGFLDFAEKRYLKVVELNTSKDLTVKSYINLGIIESNKKDKENPDKPAAKGLEYIQKALAFNPSDNDALTALGLIYYKRGAYDRAIETFYLVVKSSNDTKVSAEAYNNIGKAHYKKGEYREALRAFNLGSESDPSSEELRMNRKAASQAYENGLKTY